MPFLRSCLLVLCGLRLLLAMPPKCDEDDIFLQVRRKGLKGGGGRRAYRRNIDLENCVMKRIADAGEAGDQAKVQEILDEYNKKDAATYEDKLQQRAERAAQRAVERARAAGELPAPDTVTTPLELPDLTPEARRATRELIKSEL